MRRLLPLLLAIPAHAEPPSWQDVPALVTAAVAPVDGELRACMKQPHGWAMFAGRAKDGSTIVAMPMPPVGGRGFTPEERCLMTTIAKIKLPSLPDGIEQILLGNDVSADFGTWRDPAAAIAKVVDRAALGACGKRTVRLIFDRSHDKTRIWLPAWQFHSSTGDGTTPPREARVKACLTKAIHDWHAPVMPQAMAEIHVAFAVAP